jgi:hypothetical protein
VANSTAVARDTTDELSDGLKPSSRRSEESKDVISDEHPERSINADIDKMEFLKFIVSLFIFRAIHYR